MGTEERFIEFLNEHGVKSEYEKKLRREVGVYFPEFEPIDYLRDGKPEWYISGAFINNNKWRNLDKKWQKLNK